MIAVLAMPKLGMTMEEGTVLSWQVPVGARLEKGAPLLVIESEKAEAEIEAPAAGVLRHVYVEAGATVPCGTLLAALTEAADDPFDAEAVQRSHVPEPGMRPAPSAASSRAERAATPVSAGERGAARLAAAPAARKRAAELGVDLAQVPGRGPGGRITREDVEAAAAGLPPLVEVAPGVRLEVPVEGEGDPVLLLPGFGVDVSSFALQTRALREHHRVHGVNPRGVGRSNAPEAQSYEVGRSADDAAAVLAAPAHVIGASLGSAVALELALSRPERVRTLTLITPFLRATSRLLAVTDAWVALGEMAAPDLLARALLPWLFGAHTLADEGLRERYARGLAQAVARVPAGTLRRARAGLLSWSATRVGKLEALRVPTLVICGEDDLLTPDGASVARSLPGARLLSLPGVGHAAALEAPDAVNRAIADHLRAG